ncbi:MAG: hypothetical protein ACLFTK_11085 [Anaerolineales bacterium]
MGQQTCLNCGYTTLYYQHCKIRCENCGFMLDCSDLDIGGEVQRAQQARARAERPQPTTPSRRKNN